MDDRERVLQLAGTADAFASPEIIRIIENQPGGIQVTALEWSTWAASMLGWTRVSTREDALKIADEMRAYVRTEIIGVTTELSAALRAAAHALNTGPRCMRHVIDISSDGTDQDGEDPKLLIELLREDGIIVNALAIRDKVNEFLYRGPIIEYYRDIVSGFAMHATIENYAVAMRRKLILEIAEAPRE